MQAEQEELWSLTPEGEAVIAETARHEDPAVIDWWVGVGWELARKAQEFSTNGVIEHSKRGAAGDSPYTGVASMQMLEPRSMGTVMRRLQRAGVIRPTDRTEPDRTPGAHGRPKRIWKSLIYRGEA